MFVAFTFPAAQVAQVVGVEHVTQLAIEQVKQA